MRGLRIRGDRKISGGKGEKRKHQCPLLQMDFRDQRGICTKLACANESGGQGETPFQGRKGRKGKYNIQ